MFFSIASDTPGLILMTNFSIYNTHPLDHVAEDVNEGVVPSMVVETPPSTDLLEIVMDEAEKVLPPPSPAAETGVTPMVAVATESEDATTEDASIKTDEPLAIAEKSPKEEKPTSPVILIIEDTTELAEVIQATLERVNMVTFHETHGLRAINLLNSKNPDVVLLDISLPDMTGWKILDAIKAKHEEKKLPLPIVIVISAYGDPANRLVGKLQGVHSYLIKPFTADEVEKAVTTALSEVKP